MTSNRVAAALATVEPGECRRVPTGHGYERTVYGGRGGVWWVVRPGDTGPRWTGLDDTLAELSRYPTEAAWEAAIPADDPNFPP